MKDRLPALDGLRGLAALAVALSHSSYSPIALTSSPFILHAYRTLAVGPNSVQILFVLSGFLMAFLYPTIPSATSFIQKRYGRIMPIYATIVIFLFFLTLRQTGMAWFLELGLLIFLALSMYIGWTLLGQVRKWFPVGRALFIAFVIAQVAVLFFNLLITPHFTQADIIVLPSPLKHWLVLLSNLTLTTPLIKENTRLSGVFWSLAPEMLFYVLYPFIVLPLLQAGKKWGWLISIILVIGVTKILFDLDTTIATIGSLQSLNIARASGFVAGVTIGTIYQTKGVIWKHIENIVSSRIFGIIVLLLFIGVQWGDGAIRDGQSIFFMNSYYLISSWIIALLILAAIVPKTLPYKIFSRKILTFLGIISYSMYLVHMQIWGWASAILSPLNHLLPSQGIANAAYAILGILMTVAVSTFLFYVVEYLYFASKKKVLETTLASESEKINKEQQQFSMKRIWITVGATLIIFFVLYSGMYSPTFLLTRHSFRKTPIATTETSLLNTPVNIPFTASDTNLSALVFDLRYSKSAGATIAHRKSPALLEFQLLTASGQQIFISTQSAYLAEGQPRFPFGLPTLTDSKNKNYIVRFTLLNGQKNDQVLVQKTPTGFTSIYSTSKTNIVADGVGLILNKILYVCTNIHFLFVCLFILFVTVFLPALEKLKTRRGRKTPDLL